MKLSADIQKLPRTFLPENFEVKDWDSLKPYFEELLEREIRSAGELETWLHNLSELEAVVTEDACWRQIRMTCDTDNKEYEEAFNYFYTEIQPKIQPIADKLNRKLVESPYCRQLDKDKYFTYIRSVKNSIELFREENVPLFAELSVQQQQYGVITGKMTVNVNGQELTLQQAAKYLENPDRKLREEVYHKINSRRLQDKDALNELFTSLVAKRKKVAENAGFPNFRDYKFREMGRFDYTPEDCYEYHEAVKLHILPLEKQILEYKRQKLGLDKLRPWDVAAEPEGVEPLTPFKTGNGLLEKTIACFDKLNPYFGDCLRKMRELNRLDLESRKGKAPGGYNCPLPETGAPFIFMNAAGQSADVTTMLHEGGHAIHSFLTHHLELNAFKDYPTEMAEVASMAMELMSMEYWDIFYPDPEDLKRAKYQQLERVITIFSWIATIDKFQHWVYLHPNHSLEEREAKWMEILDEFSTGMIDHNGLEEYRKYSWQKQLHLYEVPFYYIEYGIAQLGAIGLWKQYIENPGKALDNYMKALSLGGMKTLPELYEAAGLKFSFSPAYISELTDFVKSRMEIIRNN
jgi:oligoendopeptidase F